jgi:uncharacterized membrane protein YccC
MTTAAPISAVTALYGTDPVTDLADTYARMVDELAAMVEQDDALATGFVGSMLARRLGALHLELDEMTTVVPSARDLLDLADEVDELLTAVGQVAASIANPATVRALEAPLAELIKALTELVPASFGPKAGAR